MWSEVVVFGGPALALLVGLIYFRMAEASASVPRRIATSAYGPANAIVFLAVVFAWPDWLRYTTPGLNLFYLLQALPLPLLLYSLWGYPGSKATHIALVPLAALAWFWMFTLGYWGVHGK